MTFLKGEAGAAENPIIGCVSGDGCVLDSTHNNARRESFERAMCVNSHPFQKCVQQVTVSISKNMSGVSKMCTLKNAGKN